MRTRILMMAALVSASTLALNAQAPQQPPSQPPTQPPAVRTGDTTQRTAAQPATDQVITITGCLKEEKDVAGLTPNPAERVGVTEDYILTDVKMAQSSPVSGIGIAARYEIEGIAEAELKKHLNHQVELTGRITQPTATDDDKTPDFQATSLKMVSASCPAAK
jgi:hypothetical protein